MLFSNNVLLFVVLLLRIVCCLERKFKSEGNKENEGVTKWKLQVSVLFY